MKIGFRTTLIVVLWVLNSFANMASAGLITNTYVSDQYLSIPRDPGPGASPEERTSGPASEFPTSIDIAGLDGIVTDVNVKLVGLTHTYPEDLNIGLVNPAGVGVYLMGDTGSYFSIQLVNITFDDQASAVFEEFSPITSGTYQVSPFGFDHYAIPATFGLTLDAFNGTTANGLWSLYVYDNLGADVGSLQGWEITVTTSDVPEPGSLVLFAIGLIGFVLRKNQFSTTTLANCP
ncbi:PEP-CTERM sorting domain-containing protein [Neptunicella sp. SCSIO 80796]|uniref:PEP-CTERM sorting domain-containing protein n=1 Tax=Neptunicella plasticusilytica TaxID=3117012 RepID=UPI003A4E09A9